jgi:hypothetical protein
LQVDNTCSVLVVMSLNMRIKTYRLCERREK